MIRLGVSHFWLSRDNNAVVLHFWAGGETVSVPNDQKKTSKPRTSLQLFSIAASRLQLNDYGH